MSLRGQTETKSEIDFRSRNLLQQTSMVRRGIGDPKARTRGCFLSIPTWLDPEISFNFVNPKPTISVRGTHGETLEALASVGPNVDISPDRDVSSLVEAPSEAHKSYLSPGDWRLVVNGCTILASCFSRVLQCTSFVSCCSTRACNPTRGGRSISHAIHQDMDASGVNVSSWKFNLFPRSVGFRGLIFIGCSSLCWVLGEMD